MDDLNNNLAKFRIRTPPPQARPLQTRESQGPQDFHRFPKLPPEIREMIWTFSFPGTRSIRVRPLVPEGRPVHLLNHDNKPQRVDVRFSYEDNNGPIIALKISKESRKAALSVYHCFVGGGRKIYFCPNRDTLLFEGLRAVFWKLLRAGESARSVLRLLTNTCDHEATQLAGQFAYSSPTIEWLAPCFEHSTAQTYIIHV